MEISVVEKRVPSSDGKHYLYGKLYIPSGEIKGYVQVVHGMTEHVGRYEETLEEFAKRGYLAFAFDNLGHGHTATDKLELGFIARKNGWKMLLKDVKLFYDAVKIEFGEKPYCLIGHSMGSFIVRNAVSETVAPDKVVIMGTAGKNKLAGLGIMVAKTIKLFKGERHVSKFMDKMVFGSNNKKFAHENSKRSWITSDPSVRAKYDNDELCNYRFGLSALIDLITLSKIANSNKKYKNYGNTPTFIVSGKDDPVGKFGAGALEVYDKFKKYGTPAKVKLYNARHEVFSEPIVKRQLIDDIIEFIEK